jgi:hypothetical protein
MVDGEIYRCGAAGVVSDRKTFSRCNLDNRFKIIQLLPQAMADAGWFIGSAYPRNRTQRRAVPRLPDTKSACRKYGDCREIRAKARRQGPYNRTHKTCLAHVGKDVSEGRLGIHVVIPLSL